MFKKMMNLIFNIVVCALFFVKVVPIVRDWIKVKNFVKRILKDRDESHGYKHGLDVFSLGLFLYFYDLVTLNVVFSVNVIRLIGIVGFLHDVNDGKYDKDGKLNEKLNEFLEKEFPKDCKLIIDIINRISYGKEIKMRKECGGCVDWLDKLGIEGCIVRNYVSDADKCLSLGKKGHVRTREYNTCEISKRGEKVTEKKLYDEINLHVLEKLQGLEKYCYTSAGFRLALKRRIEFCKIHEEWGKMVMVQ